MFLLEREKVLQMQLVALKKQCQALQQQYQASTQRHADAMADRKDVLLLVDIMSASPVGIKTVLEAYLKQLGEFYFIESLTKSLLFVQ